MCCGNRKLDPHGGVSESGGSGHYAHRTRGQQSQVSTGGDRSSPRAVSGDRRFPLPPVGPGRSPMVPRPSGCMHVMHYVMHYVMHM